MIIKFLIKFEISRGKPHPLSTRESWRRLRKLVRNRDKGICQYCGELSQDGQADHVIPLSQGGSDTMSNLIWSCKICNNTKKGKTPEEWEEWLDNLNSKKSPLTESLEEEIEEEIEEEVENEDDSSQNESDEILEAAQNILDIEGWIDKWMQDGRLIYGWQTEIGRQLDIVNAGSGYRKILRIGDEILRLFTSSTDEEVSFSIDSAES